MNAAARILDPHACPLTVPIPHTGGTVLGPGEALYVSPLVRKFRARTSGPRGNQALFVVGPYAGHLSPTDALTARAMSRKS